MAQAANPIAVKDSACEAEAPSQWALEMVMPRSKGSAKAANRPWARGRGCPKCFPMTCGVIAIKASSIIVAPVRPLRPMDDGAMICGTSHASIVRMAQPAHARPSVVEGSRREVRVEATKAITPSRARQMARPDGASSA